MINEDLFRYLKNINSLENNFKIQYSLGGHTVFCTIFDKPGLFYSSKREKVDISKYCVVKAYFILLGLRFSSVTDVVYIFNHFK